MDAKKRLTIFQRFAEQNPNPVTELIYKTDFELLVAVMLSAQATDSSVNKATFRLFQVADTPEKLLELGEEGLKSYIKSINYYHTKARHLIKTAGLLIHQYGSRVPADRQSLEKLPGVGRKTANVVLNVLFKKPTIPVDTHIFRVSNRTGLAIGKTPLLVEQQLEATTPKQYLSRAHQWLVLHGRYVCVARGPRCGQCIISDLCEYPEKTFPVKSVV